MQLGPWNGGGSRSLTWPLAPAKPNTEKPAKDDPRARYVNAPGLYRLVCRSMMDKADGQG